MTHLWLMLIQLFTGPGYTLACEELVSRATKSFNSGPNDSRISSAVFVQINRIATNDPGTSPQLLAQRARI